MKSIRALFAAALLFFGVSATSAMAQDLAIINGTGFTLAALSLSDSASSEAQDLLGNETLANGEGIQIDLQGSPVGWDLIAVDGQGGYVTWGNLDLTGVSQITLFADGTAQAE